jgi:hypothetical protein
LGGQDVVYVKQDRSSPLSPSEIKEHLDRLGDQLFTGTCTLPPSNRKLREHKSKVSDTRPEQLFLAGFNLPVTKKNRTSPRNAFLGFLDFFSFSQNNFGQNSEKKSSIQS